MAEAEYTLTIRLPWWFDCYLWVLKAACCCGLKPNPEPVARRILDHLRFEVVSSNG